MEQLEKMVVELHMEIVSQDQALEGAQKAVEGWSTNQLNGWSNWENCNKLWPTKGPQ